MLKKDVMRTPQTLESGNTNHEDRTVWSVLRVGTKQSQIVVDMFQDIDEEVKVRFWIIRGSEKANRAIPFSSLLTVIRINALDGLRFGFSAEG